MVKTPPTAVNPPEPPQSTIPTIRQAIYSIPREALGELVTGRMRVTNIPETAKLESCWFDYTDVGSLRLRMSDDSLPETQIGSRLPQIEAVCAAAAAPQKGRVQ